MIADLVVWSWIFGAFAAYFAGMLIWIIVAKRKIGKLRAAQARAAEYQG
jgi:hypothetical protein